VNLFRIILFSVAMVASIACLVLLLRGYLRERVRLLLWSSLCFVGLSINNVLLFFDLVVFPAELDLRPYRLLAALAGLGCLLYGFLSEAE
jgi:hypothetical protein